MATSTIKYDSIVDVSSLFTPNSSFVSGNYSVLKYAYRCGRIVRFTLVFHPSQASLQNKTMFTVEQGIRPASNQYFVALVIPVYNQQSKTIAVSYSIDTNGNVRTSNNGAYGELHTMTELTEVMLIGTYLI